ncbi:interferon-inducible double-stranded RNA-dependent protein kinase activator A homolog [Kryptolebias marmoratus]|uniref:Protein kinase, interferon-inducible double stranded RNA dependent activator n=1 Tax=Kryptolebias marmoratus TaxID=37003 RepID=A0A3Q3AYZ0_KRYMA|nr:interferon-inducible double-stranded RNA-dependent protein kinase activator A homolog [Kryptolebias marmoratus]
MSQQEYLSPSPAPDEKSVNSPEPQWSGKTPIQMLHEYGTASGTPPVYEMEKAEGSGHQPNFFFSVTVGDIKCTGQGPTKKAAKHQAADAALKMLNLDPEKGISPGRSDSNGIAAETNFNPNSVCLLQELAIQRGWRRPEYTVLTQSGPPHQREFTVACRFESLTEKGVGSSKKAAKRTAAEKVVAKLQSLSGGSEITWTPKPSVLFENIRNSAAEKISLLRRNPLSIPNTDYIQMLLELSKEQGFEVTYFDIDELTVNGQYQCLAELSTEPVTVCHGTGISCSNAHNDAAHSALQYIKIVAAGK